MKTDNSNRIRDNSLACMLAAFEAKIWTFSIVDVCAVLTEQPDAEHARNYWKVLKHRLIKEGNQTVTTCNRLKLRAADGKLRLTDVADTEQLFRLIQSIPSPKAEPFKQWMAQVASTRLEQMQDPEKSIDQAVMDYKRLGYSDAWINQRIKSILRALTNRSVWLRMVAVWQKLHAINWRQNLGIRLFHLLRQATICHHQIIATFLKSHDNIP